MRKLLYLQYYLQKRIAEDAKAREEKAAAKRKSNEMARIQNLQAKSMYTPEQASTRLTKVDADYDRAMKETAERYRKALEDAKNSYHELSEKLGEDALSIPGVPLQLMTSRELDLSRAVRASVAVPKGQSGVEATVASSHLTASLSPRINNRTHGGTDYFQ